MIFSLDEILYFHRIWQNHKKTHEKVIIVLEWEQADYLLLSFEKDDFLKKIAYIITNLHLHTFSTIIPNIPYQQLIKEICYKNYCSDLYFNIISHIDNYLIKYGIIVSTKNLEKIKKILENNYKFIILKKIK